jgi:hypothetical protein
MSFWRMAYDAVSPIPAAAPATSAATINVTGSTTPTPFIVGRPAE